MPKKPSASAKSMSRRKALSILGFAATAAYVAPVVLNVSNAKAGDERSRTRTRTRTRTHPDR